jgi:transketolase
VWPHPLYIRLAKGGDKIVSSRDNEFEIGKSILMRNIGDGLFITTGVMTQKAMEAANQLSKEGVECGVLHMHTIKPMDYIALEKLIPKVNAAVTVEEHFLTGGFGSAVLEYCSDSMPQHVSKIARIGIRDKFPDKYGTQDTLLEYLGITVDSIKQKMLNKLKNT